MPQLRRASPEHPDPKGPLRNSQLSLRPSAGGPTSAWVLTTVFRRRRCGRRNGGGSRVVGGGFVVVVDSVVVVSGEAERPLLPE
jgi:hypothetical protein